MACCDVNGLNSGLWRMVYKPVQWTFMLAPYSVFPFSIFWYWPLIINSQVGDNFFFNFHRIKWARCWIRKHTLKEWYFFYYTFCSVGLYEDLTLMSSDFYLKYSGTLYGSLNLLRFNNVAYIALYQCSCWFQNITRVLWCLK